MVFNISLVESVIPGGGGGGGGGAGGGGGGGVLPCIGHIDMPLYPLSGVLAPYWFENRYTFCLESK